MGFLGLLSIHHYGRLRHHFLLIQTKQFTREYAIQTEQELASGVESRRARGGED